MVKPIIGVLVVLVVLNLGAFHLGTLYTERFLSSCKGGPNSYCIPQQIDEPPWKKELEKSLEQIYTETYDNYEKVRNSEKESSEASYKLWEDSVEKGLSEASEGLWKDWREKDFYEASKKLWKDWLEASADLGYYYSLEDEEFSNTYMFWVNRTIHKYLKKIKTPAPQDDSPTLKDLTEKWEIEKVISNLSKQKSDLLEKAEKREQLK